MDAAFETFPDAKRPRIVPVHRSLTADTNAVELTADVFVIILIWENCTLYIYVDAYRPTVVRIDRLGGSDAVTLRRVNPPYLSEIMLENK